MGVMFTPEWLGVNFTLKIGVSPVASNSHQLTAVVCVLED